MTVFYHKVFGSFGTIPLNSWGSIFAIIEWMLSCKELIQLINNLKMILILIAIFDYYCKFSL